MLGNMGDNPFTRKAWNDIIDIVNLIASEPPQDTDCSPLGPLEHVPPEHIWTTGDVKAVQDKLMEICDENTFDDELTLWRDHILEEIATAMAQGWCHCDPEKCYAEGYTTVLSDTSDIVNYVVTPHGCDQAASPCVPTPPRPHYDYYSVGSSETGFGVGIGGSIVINRIYLTPWGQTVWSTVYANTFDCQGNQTQPIPPPVFDQDGNLVNSYIDYEYDVCYPCTLMDGDMPCWIGLPQCPGNPWPSGPTGTRILYVLTKTPGGAWAGGLPCRRCCADGIGFCGKDCDPTKIPCVDKEDNPE
jgi:hypothetical protein